MIAAVLWVLLQAPPGVAACPGLEACTTLATEIVSAAVSAGREHGVKPWDLIGVAYRESKFNPEAVSSSGDTGVWQLNPRSEWGKRAAALCRADRGGCVRYQAFEAAWLLRHERRRCRGRVGAFSAYHHGQRCGRSDYSDRVVAGIRKLKRIAKTYQ